MFQLEEMYMAFIKSDKNQPNTAHYKSTHVYCVMSFLPSGIVSRVFQVVIANFVF